jgi:hypothetical protein
MLPVYADVVLWPMFAVMGTALLAAAAVIVLMFWAIKKLKGRERK